ncbi:MAG TPA: hypothetical protein VFE35_05610 [Candidatus Cybelea sp.]|nr:hypothetical protein [Candidatus Cybelea sp.]
MIFELSPNGSGETERILHVFKDDSVDGGMPESGLVFGSGGYYCGTTEFGGHGPNLGAGTIFEGK